MIPCGLYESNNVIQNGQRDLASCVKLQSISNEKENAHSTTALGHVY